MVRKAFRSADHPHYRWVALSNTTLGVLMSTINSSIVLISLPAIFKGINLDPLQPANVSYLLWMIMGYMLVSAVLVVTFGKMGDQYGRVKIYNLGFVIFTVASIALSLDFFSGAPAGLWLIAWRCVQAVGGAMLLANSTAILTDAFPANKRGFALGLNQVAALAGSFIGLVLGGLLAAVDWRAVFLISVPVGIVGTVWAYASLHEVGKSHKTKIDWLGNATFGLGLVAVLVAITYGIQPYGHDSQGWLNPWVLGGIVVGVALLVLFVLLELRVRQPMVNMRLFRSRPFSANLFAGLLASIGRGGLQFMLIIWLQGIWLPLHGFSYESTPFWAGIYLLPLTLGFLIAGPLCGALTDRWGSRWLSGTGLVLVAITFVALLLIPVNFGYWEFAILTGLNGFGSGMFSAPNRTAIMNSVPAADRGAASGLSGMALNAGSSLSIGIFFSLMTVGLAAALPAALTSGLTSNGVPASVAAGFASIPPVGSLFAAFLGYNPIQTLLGPSGVLNTPGVNAQALTGQQFFPQLISAPFHTGLAVVFIASAILTLVAAIAVVFGGRASDLVTVTASTPAVREAQPGTAA